MNQQNCSFFCLSIIKMWRADYVQIYLCVVCGVCFFFFRCEMCNNVDVKRRYDEKIKLCEGIDPYMLDKNEISRSYEDLPSVNYFDLCNYFVYTKSAYTQQEMSAYKSLEAHKLFENGWVKSISLKTIPNEKCIVVGAVEHTQKLNLPPLKPWALCEKSGKVIAAHCTCIAGLGEACTHAAALLFGVESLVRTHANVGKTDVLCTWNGPSNSIGILRVKKVEDMLFPAKQYDQCIASPKFPTASQDEIFAFLQKVKNNSLKAPVACYIAQNLNEEFSTRNLLNDDVLVEQNEARVQFANKLNDSRPKVFVSGSWRCIELKLTEEQFERAIGKVTLQTYYKNEYKDFDLQMLLHASRSIAMSITEDDARFVESITRDQHKNWIWQKLRVGRVTGSIFKNVCRTLLKKPAKTLLMKMCYPEKSKFSCKATEYGIQNEDEAKKSFIYAMRLTHKNFSCNATGLVIDYTNHFFAVSPDGSCECDCCGEYLLELKCPYSLSDKNSTYDVLLKITDPYIERTNGMFTLKKSHSYYYQIQLQLAVCRKKLCYLYVWAKHLEPISIVVNFDPKFMEENLPKAYSLVDQVVIPELMNSFYTKTY